MKNDFYVYVLFRPTGVPFYIGKGRRARWTCHERKAVAGRSKKDNIIIAALRLGLPIPKIKLHENLNSEQAALYEIALIAAIGREPDGPLVNMTDGGEGAKQSKPEELLARSLRMKKLWSLESYRSKTIAAATQGIHNMSKEDTLAKHTAISAGLKGKKHGLERIEKMRKTKTGRPMSEAHKAAIGRGNKGKVFTQERRDNISKSLKGRQRKPMHEAQKAKISSALKGKPKTEAHKESLRNAARIRRQISKGICGEA